VNAVAGQNKHIAEMPLRGPGQLFSTPWVGVLGNSPFTPSEAPITPTCQSHTAGRITRPHP
jgi:hypothetical protein